MLRKAPEKLLRHHFEGVVRRAPITADVEEGQSLPAAPISDIIVKPIYGNGGAGVFHIALTTQNLASLLELFTTNMASEPVMAAALWLNVVGVLGDKQIPPAPSDASPRGRHQPRAAAGEARSNMRVRATAGDKPRLKTRADPICDQIGPALRERGIIFAGIDVDRRLPDRESTSPRSHRVAGDQPLKARLSQADIWDAIERRLR